jgi:hypothetical protein
VATPRGAAARVWVKSHAQTILIGLVIVLAIIAVFLFIQLDRSRHDLTTATNAMAFLLDHNKALEQQLTDTQQTLADTQANLASSEESNRSLEDELAAVTDQRDEASARAELYQEQKFFEAEVMYWIGRQFGYTDLEDLTLSYSAATGMQPPQSCEPVTADRYNKWISTTGTIFVASPEKMGWSPYAGWSIRENVVFGPEHLNAPGYIGSRGFEFRYPLVPGSFPLQEVHTTINAFDKDLDENYWQITDGIAAIDLNCGATGTITVATDTDETKTIYFVLENFAVNVKLKYFYNNLPEAERILTQAANVVIAGLTGGW